MSGEEDWKTYTDMFKDNPPKSCCNATECVYGKKPEPEVRCSSLYTHTRVLSSVSYLGLGSLAESINQFNLTEKPLE